MRLICVHCGTIVEQGSSWCTNVRTNCPLGTLSLLFDNGESLDDMQVRKLLRLFPLSALYRVKRNNQTFLLKVAHRGYEENLKREAHMLAEIGAHPVLPRIIQNTSARPYFKTTVHDEVKYYTVMESADGTFLDDLLQQSPQPPPRNTAWLGMQLASALVLLKRKFEIVLLNLRPDSILVRQDKAGVYRPILYDLGFAREIGMKPPQWFNTIISVAYAAPESLQGQACNHSTTVYGLGILLYEMFAGQSVIARHGETREQVVAAVIHQRAISLKSRRPEFSASVTMPIETAVQTHPHQRQVDVSILAKQLREAFGDVPPETSHLRIYPELIAIVVAILVIVLLLILLVSLMQP